MKPFTLLGFEKKHFCTFYKVSPEKVLDLRVGVNKKIRKQQVLGFILHNLAYLLDETKEVRIICH